MFEEALDGTKQPVEAARILSLSYRMPIAGCRAGYRPGFRPSLAGAAQDCAKAKYVHVTNARVQTIRLAQINTAKNRESDPCAAEVCLPICNAVARIAER
jgi:hypothetical protein